MYVVAFLEGPVRYQPRNVKYARLTGRRKSAAGCIPALSLWSGSHPPHFFGVQQLIITVVGLLPLLVG